MWPVEGAALEPATVALLRERAYGLDLDVLAADTRPQIDAGERLRRLVTKLDRARDRVSGWLFGA